ncbi:MAG: hypothetical protein HY092_02390 [Candidatus Kerfeldbacteria bacterium]|nr:hypothetical protein [Candidatus Kerfeldbacteria bacterium]
MSVLLELGVPVAESKKPKGRWYRITQYCITWWSFVTSAFFTNVPQRSVIMGGEHLKLKAGRIFALTHRTLWDSFWIGAAIIIRNLKCLFFNQKLIPLNLPDGTNFMGTKLLRLFMGLLRCLPVFRADVMNRHGENADEQKVRDRNEETWNDLKEHLRNGGTVLWFMTSGRDLIVENGQVVDGTCVSRPNFMLGRLVLECHELGIEVDVVPGYTVNNSQTYRKTRDALVGWWWNLIPSQLAFRKFLKSMCWYLAFRPFRYANKDCLVANFGPPLSRDFLKSKAGNRAAHRQAFNIAQAVNQAIRELKPTVDQFRSS